MSDSPEPGPGPRRPYIEPAFESEQVFETMALRCGKTGDSGGDGGDGGGDRGGGGKDRYRVYKSCNWNRKNS